jgi:glycosyltransferase involved in cell wall biosynthesis
MKPRVLLVSTVHPPTDPRIVYKIAASLSADYEVFCILPHARQTDSGIDLKLISLPFFQYLYLRLLLTHPLLLLRYMLLRPAVVHIFVPELIPVAILFQWLGARVIYEVQENLYKKFDIKKRNNGFVFRYFFRHFDHLARQRFWLIFTEDSYLEEYKVLKNPATVVHNYVSLPFIDRYAGAERNLSHPPHFFYSGVITMERCFDTLVAALVKLKDKLPDFQVHLFGLVRLTEQELEEVPGYRLIKRQLNFHGYTDLKIVVKYARQSVAGIALLKPVADYPESYSSKLFEYMALNLPIITSDFPLYQRVVEKANCGFCIDPYDPQKLAETMQWLVANPQSAREMGKRGRGAAKAQYSWETEEKILLSLYKEILVH